MTLRPELDEAINEIESVVARKTTTVKLIVHRWEQVLRILKFYRLKWNDLHDDPLWDGDQSQPDSPYYHRGLAQDDLARMHAAYLERSHDGQ
jgi:hypothetical protein